MRRLKVYYKAGCAETIPVILLQGEWLRKIGFEYNEHIIIAQENRKLIIELEKEN